MFDLTQFKRLNLLNTCDWLTSSSQQLSIWTKLYRGHTSGVTFHSIPQGVSWWLKHKQTLTFFTDAIFFKNSAFSNGIIPINRLGYHIINQFLIFHFLALTALKKNCVCIILTFSSAVLTEDDGGGGRPAAAASINRRLFAWDAIIWIKTIVLGRAGRWSDFTIQLLMVWRFEHMIMLCLEGGVSCCCTLVKIGLWVYWS